VNTLNNKGFLGGTSAGQLYYMGLKKQHNIEHIGKVIGGTYLPNNDINAKIWQQIS
jgi:hypothetical protein